MKSTPPSIRKAALLIASLDRDTADNLIERMPAEQAAMVRAVLADLEHIDATEQDAAIDDFLENSPSSTARAALGKARDEQPRVAQNLEKMYLSGVFEGLPNYKSNYEN